ncbi:ABC transporter permease [Lacrimispora amygdalina]|uniref:ABC transporter permease n=1 Tax=Lacrimispora TaxID=2719231 RepID=UPI001FA84522|nr:ABC transporter permease [Lacrimispora amygdalina]MDK2967369.1 putative spermidine/putrescine transport system permease protein [Lacrimispora sp.]
MMKEKVFGKIFPYLLILPSLVILAGVVFYPIAASLLRSFELEEGGLGLDNYLYFFTDKIQRDNIIYTLQVVMITVLLAVGVSYFLALYLRFSNTWTSRLIGRLYLLPRFIPGLVAVNGMITVIRDSGLINRISRLFGLEIKLGLMYNSKGIILMNLWFNIPFATMLLAAALSKIQNSSIEAARDSGAGKLQILRTMILPLTYRDIFITATFVFMSNLGSFTTPYLMGGNNPQMLGISLYSQFNNGHYERAAALSVIMFLLSLLSAVVYVYTNMKKSEWEKGNG